MKLLCDKCHKEKEFTISTNNLIHFECGNTREITSKDWAEIFRRYGGER